jgi:hypothetical protein
MADFIFCGDSRVRDILPPLLSCGIGIAATVACFGIFFVYCCWLQKRACCCAQSYVSLRVRHFFVTRFFTYQGAWGHIVILLFSCTILCFAYSFVAGVGFTPWGLLSQQPGMVFSGGCIPGGFWPTIVLSGVLRAGQPVLGLPPMGCRFSGDVALQAGGLLGYFFADWGESCHNGIFSLWAPRFVSAGGDGSSALGLFTYQILSTAGANFFFYDALGSYCNVLSASPQVVVGTFCGGFLAVAYHQYYYRHYVVVSHYACGRNHRWYISR